MAPLAEVRERERDSYISLTVAEPVHAHAFPNLPYVGLID